MRGGMMLAVLFAICYFMFGMMAYQLIKPDIAIQRGATYLNCADPDTSGDAVTCLILGSVIPFLILTIVSVTGGIITKNAIT